MGVHIDEAGADYASRGVDCARCLNSRGLPPDDGHRVPGHANVGAEPGLSRAVNDSAACYQQIKHLHLHHAASEKQNLPLA